MKLEDLNLPEGLVERILYAAGPRRDAVLAEFARFQVVVPEEVAMAAPVIEDPVAEGIVEADPELAAPAEEPVAEAPVAEEPAAEEPAAEEPAAEEPAPETPVV